VTSPVFVASTHLSHAWFLPHQMSPPTVTYRRLSLKTGVLLTLLGLTSRLRRYWLTFSFGPVGSGSNRHTRFRVSTLPSGGATVSGSKA